MERPAGSGTWMLRAAFGTDPITGKARRKSWTFQARGRRAAERQAARLIEGYEQKGISGTTATLEQLLEEFLRISAARGRSPTTLHEYQRIFGVGPVTGSDPPRRAHRAPSRHLLRPGMTGPRAVSPSSVRRYHALISAALNQALKWGWIDRNPATRATPAAKSSERLEVPTPEQVRALIAACRLRNEQLGMFVLLAAVTGCRRGELAALRWRDIDRDQITISASLYSIGREHGVKSTKTGRVRVIIAGSQVRNAIEQWRTKVESEADAWGVRVGPDACVLSARPGSDVPPNIDTVSSSIRRVADSLGLRHVHLHSLRHFAATEMLGTGISARDAAERRTR